MSEGFETHERINEHGHAGAPRWISVAAATLAVLAALTTLLGNVRATAANAAKADAIIAQTRAADTYNEYESRSIKRHIYEAAALQNPGQAAALGRIAASERSKGAPLLDRARALEAESRHDEERSERLLGAYETIEVGATLLEIAIVLVSISAFVEGKVLPAASLAATLAGLAIALTGLLR